MRGERCLLAGELLHCGVALTSLQCRACLGSDPLPIPSRRPGMEPLPPRRCTVFLQSPCTQSARARVPLSFATSDTHDPLASRTFSA